jgi:SAM-dependent methyltransferase
MEMAVDPGDAVKGRGPADQKELTKLHLGCLTNVIPGWDNLDIVEGEGVIFCDLRNDLPYADASVSRVFSEHLIEHLTKEVGVHLLTECFRVLVPGGCMRIGWPDLARLLRAYVIRRRAYRRFVMPYFTANVLGTWDEVLSDCLFDWDHRYAYTSRHLAMILRRIGFSEIRRRRFMESGYGIVYDVRNDPATSYLEALKPAQDSG